MQHQKVSVQPHIAHAPNTLALSAPFTFAHTKRTMADNKEALRALKIKTGVLTRVKKELAMYTKEVTTETEKLKKMQSEGRDAHDIKQQVRSASARGRGLKGCV